MMEYTRFMYCPRCGLAEMKDISVKSMRCTECGYVYFHNTAAAAGAIIETGEGVIVTVRANDPHSGKYDLPGGFTDYNESLEDAVRREVREELGIEVTVERYLGSFPNTYTFRRVEYFTCDTFFVCRPQQKDAQIAVSSEIKSWETVPEEQLPDLAYAFDSHRKALMRYCNKE